MLLIATFSKGRSALLDCVELGKFRLGFLMAVIVYNWTEAAFKNISPMWFIFCLIALDTIRNEPSSIPDAERLSLEGDTLLYTELEC